jgi:hypothetical protein
MLHTSSRQHPYLKVSFPISGKGFQFHFNANCMGPLELELMDAALSKNGLGLQLIVLFLSPPPLNEKDRPNCFYNVVCNVPNPQCKYGRPSTTIIPLHFPLSFLNL